MFKLLVLPPASLLLLAALAFLVRRRRPALSRLLFAAVFMLAYVASLPLVAGHLLASLQWYPAIGIREAPADGAGAIVVLSAELRRESPEYGGESVGPLTLERLRYAAVLAKRTGLPLLVSGGTLRNAETSLAALMAESLAEDFGIDAVWLEDRSETTAENAAYSSRILEQQNIASVYLVTHAWHMPRAKSAFERYGIRVLPAPTGFVSQGDGFSLGDWVPQAGALAGTSYAIHEWLGILWYWLRFDVLGDEAVEEG